MKDTYISDSILYVGVDDKTIDLFESQYVVPNGVSYNSYVIMDDKIAIMDTVDHRATDEWMDNLDKALAGRKPDYLVIQHLEPDHSGSIEVLADKFPEMQFVSNPKLFNMMGQFFEFDFQSRQVVVNEGDTLELGKHTLTFVMAPMVHWPEVMVTYEISEKILFAADGFGKFGALDTEEDWACEARRYYINIVGKYGANVLALLKKAATLDIAMICPLHGPILKEDLGYYIGKYMTWASYEPEDEGVTIAYGSIHGNTAKAAKLLGEMLEKRGQKVSLFDLARDDMAEAIEDAFRYDKLVIASVTYDANVFPAVQDFVYHLQLKNYQKRTVGIMQNGSWGPVAGKKIKEQMETLKNIKIVDPMVTIKSTLKEGNLKAMEALADALVAK
jgi:flavorubredoxin